MRFIFEFTGMFAYLILHPFWAYYLGKSNRARVVLIHERKVLLVKHWLGLRTWDTPGGGAHGNEDLKVAGAREVAEELQIIIDPKIMKFVDKREDNFGLIHFSAHYYLAKVKEPNVPHPKFPEILEAKWFALNELANLPMKQADRDIVTHCLKSR